MKIAINDLQLNNLTIIIPGDYNFPLSETIRVFGLKQYLNCDIS